LSENQPESGALPRCELPGIHASRASPALRTASARRGLAGPPQAVADEQQQARPDRGEAQRLAGVEGFAEEEHAQQQADGRGDVLQDANQRQGDALHAIREADQRQCGDRAAQDQQQVVLPASAAEERALAPEGGALPRCEPPGIHASRASPALRA